MAYDDSNRGAIFVNDRKEKETHPDMRGTINVDGKDFFISGWWREPSKGGNEFLSLSIQPKEGGSGPRTAPTKPHPVARRGRPQPAAPVDDDSDPIPF